MLKPRVSGKFGKKMEKFFMHGAISGPTLSHEKSSTVAASNLPKPGVTLCNWSDADRKGFQRLAQIAWERWGDKNDQARPILESHMAYLRQLGLIE